MTYNRGRNESAVSKESVAKVGDIVESILRKMLNKPPHLPVFLNWEKIVGKSWSSKCRPYKVMTQDDRKILVLKAKKGCSLELQYSSEQILGRVNDFLGKQTFSSLKVIQLDHDEF